MKYFLSRKNSLKALLEGKSVYLFLDFDGTLAPIVNKPGKAILPKKTKEILKGLAESAGFKIAIVSGRTARDVEKRVGLKNVIYVGNHGFEIIGPKIRLRRRLPLRYRRVIGRIKNDLARGLFSFGGVLIEDKGFSLAVHYRMARKGDISAIKKIFNSIVLPYVRRNWIKVNPGKMIAEIKPGTSWNKGSAVLWLLSKLKKASKGAKALPIYIGDDVTDEDAFMALENKGITVMVGKPKRSKASFYLRGTEDVARFLNALF